MGSGRGDRNQCEPWAVVRSEQPLQWGPVVVTGISQSRIDGWFARRAVLQWGPVVVTGISPTAHHPSRRSPCSFNGVRSW